LSAQLVAGTAVLTEAEASKINKTTYWEEEDCFGPPDDERSGKGGGHIQLQDYATEVARRITLFEKADELFSVHL